MEDEDRQRLDNGENIGKSIESLKFSLDNLTDVAKGLEEQLKRLEASIHRIIGRMR